MLPHFLDNRLIDGGVVAGLTPYSVQIVVPSVPKKGSGKEKCGASWASAPYLYLKKILNKNRKYAK
jgi:hypothetical protein